MSNLVIKGVFHREVIINAGSKYHNGGIGGIRSSLGNDETVVSSSIQRERNAC